MQSDEHFMRLAIEQARIGEWTSGDGEVGCVIVRDDSVLAEGCNEVERTFDPTAHAEITTLRKLGQRLQTTDFHGCTLYCTLQPCSMCTVACIWGKITRIVYGAARKDVHQMYFDAKHLDASDLIRDAFRNDIEILGGVLLEECIAFYYQPGDHPSREEQANI